MAIKSFNIQEDVYKVFSSFCKENGISMSKHIEFFMKSCIEKEPTAKKSFLKKLEKVRKGKFIRVDNFAKEYGLNE